MIFKFMDLPIVRFIALLIGIAFIVLFLRDWKHDRRVRIITREEIYKVLKKVLKIETNEKKRQIKK